MILAKGKGGGREYPCCSAQFDTCALEALADPKDQRHDEALALDYLRRYNDQLLTVSDVTSMAVVARLGLGRVFTFGWHFSLLGIEVIPSAG